MNHVQNTEGDYHNETKFERRTFLSAAFCSATLMLSPSIVTASDLPDSDILPSPADSLTLYLVFLDKIGNELLKKFVAEVSSRARDVRISYERLAKLADDLEKEAPSLKNRTETSHIKKVTDVGLTSASRINPVMQNGMFSSALYVELISVSTNSLNSSVNQLQQESLTLSPKAVEILKEILQEIPRLDTLTSSLNESTETLSKVITDINPKIDSVRKKLTDAIQVLVRVELKLEPELNQKEAIQFIRSAISELKELDNLSLTLQTKFSTKTSPTSLQQDTSSSQTQSPTALLRGLLEDTIVWILKRNNDQESSRSNSTVKFINVSADQSSTTALNLGGLWWEVRHILADLLPQASSLRTCCCIALITPILVAGHELSIREKKIYGLISRIYPRGSVRLR